MTTEEELLTTKEVADLLGIEPQAVRRYHRQGRLPGTRLPSMGGRGHLRFRRADIEKATGLRKTA